MSREKRTGTWTLAAILMGAALTITGCGTASSASGAYFAEDTAKEASADTGSAVTQSSADSAGTSAVSAGTMAVNGTAAGTEESAASEDPASQGNDSSGTEELTEYGQKLIRTVQISAETRDLDSFDENLTSQVNAAGGYIESMSRDGSSSIVTYYNDAGDGSYDADALSGTSGERYAYYTIRIPAEKLDSFLGTVEKETNVLNQSFSTQDVTLNYIDVDSQRKALEEEQKKLLEMMDKAETMDDMIKIESQLTDVRSQLQNIKSQLRYLDNQVSYSTVNLDVTEVKAYTPQQELSAGARMKQGFEKSLQGLREGLEEAGIWTVIHLPYLIFWAVVILVLVLILRGIRHRCIKRRQRKCAQNDNEKTMPGTAVKKEKKE